MNNCNVAIACAGILLGALYFNRRKQRVRSCKVREINRNRKFHGFFNTTFIPMKNRDPQQFFKYTRMTVPVFNKLLQLVTPALVKKQLPDSVSVEERLAVTLHYLSQGTSMQTIAWTYHLGHATVHKIILEVCLVLWEVLSPEYMKPPCTNEEWRKIAADFYTKWNFPNCVGALDGKHINIQAPANSGSLYYNYKKFFSIVLLAACDADYNFTLIDVRAYGSQSDGGIFKESIFGDALDKGQMNLPQPSPIPLTNIIVPYAFVADAAFPLKGYIMRPFPGKYLEERELIFNYRLSRARRVIENSFGVLVARWRLLKKTICADVKNVDNFVKAAVCLHNYVKRENPAQYCPPGYVDTDTSRGDWRQETEELPSVHRLASNNSRRITYRIRQAICQYFLTPEGEVPWQYERVRRGRGPVD